MLSALEQSRYLRQITLPEIEAAGQIKLKAAKVLCIGLGGLGCPLSLYLAGSGIGTLGLVDGDVVSLSNLPRQLLYTTTMRGQPKTDSAYTVLKAINPHCEIQCYDTFLSAENAEDMINQYDIVADCTDNFEARYLINDTSYRLKKPVVFACVQKFQGYCTVFPSQPSGPCYRCLFENPPTTPIPNCADGGVLGTVPGLLGTLQANEIIKLILGIGESLVGKLLLTNLFNMNIRTVALKPSPTCPLCAVQPGASEKTGVTETHTALP